MFTFTLSGASGLDLFLIEWISKIIFPELAVFVLLPAGFVGAPR